MALDSKGDAAGVKRAADDLEDAEDTGGGARVKRDDDADGKARRYDAVEVVVHDPVRQVLVRDPEQRLANWGRMKAIMAGACRMDAPDDATREPTVSRGEAVYCVATAPHPLTGDAVCLVEKSRGGGYVMVLEAALTPILGRGEITAQGQQYSKWVSMEEQLGVSPTPDFKALVGHLGYIIARAQHPKDPAIDVLAVQIPEAGTVLVKSTAVAALPVDVVEIVDPLARYHPWPEMAAALRMTEPKEPPRLVAGMLGRAQGERKHLFEEDTTVVAVELISGDATVMMDSRGLRAVRY